MKLYFTLATLVFLSIVTFVSCKKHEEPKFHLEYFGLEENRYVVYDVVEITHDAALAQHDTAFYELKTVWGPEYINNEGQSTNEFHRYTRDNSNENWLFLDMWTGRIDGIRAELVEENQRIVKLVFAPTFEKSWNSNEYNMFDDQQCYYSDIHQSEVVNNINFDSTLTVQIEESFNFIDSVSIYEKYAKNVGLIYKHVKDNHYQFTDEVDMGYELYYTFKETGYQ